jgi:hypothetical protein
LAKRGYWCGGREEKDILKEEVEEASVVRVEED